MEMEIEIEIGGKGNEREMGRGQPSKDTKESNLPAKELRESMCKRSGDSEMCVLHS